MEAGCHDTIHLTKWKGKNNEHLLLFFIMLKIVWTLHLTLFWPVHERELHVRYHEHGTNCHICIWIRCSLHATWIITHFMWNAQKHTYLNIVLHVFFICNFFHFRFTTPNFKRTQETSNESTKTIFCCRISEIKIGALLFRSHRKINHHRSIFLFSALFSSFSYTTAYYTLSLPSLLTLPLSLAYTSFFMAFRCQSRIFRIGENLCQYDLVACARNKSFIRNYQKLQYISYMMLVVSSFVVVFFLI